MSAAAPSASEAPKHLAATVILRIVAGPHLGEEFAFHSHNTLVVGRAADAQWRMAKDPFFSRYHFRLEIDPPSCRLEDLESSNGTQVNGQRVQSADLKHGDQIVCGDTVFDIVVIAGGDHRLMTTANLTPRARPAPQPSDITPLPLDRLADFDLTRELGRGGMGIVYHAIQRATGREVAVKLIAPTKAVRPEAMQLFLREASILAQLRHPRIVESIGIGLHQGQVYLAMEYVPVIDLRELIARQPRPMQIRVLCGIACRALEALQFAHAHDIVHRDVKPSNIFVYRQDGNIQVKLADFGLAKNFITAGFSSITHEEEIRGTIGFMAPEQLINCRFAKPPCDVYGMGACLYYLLSGQTPYDTTDAKSAIAMILNSPPRPLEQRAPDLPPPLVQLVVRAMARNPADRFPSADDMRQALLKFTEK